MNVTLRLTLDITYTTNGVQVKDLEDGLKAMSLNASLEGQLTGYTAAEVVSWSSEVSEVT